MEKFKITATNADGSIVSCVSFNQEHFDKNRVDIIDVAVTRLTLELREKAEIKLKSYDQSSQ